MFNMSLTTYDQLFIVLKSLSAQYVIYIDKGNGRLIDLWSFLGYNDMAPDSEFTVCLYETDKDCDGHDLFDSFTVKIS